MKIIAMFLLLSIYIFGDKMIKIDLSKQKFYAIENGKVVFGGDISSGKRGYRTPVGTFRILDKERFHISNKYPEPNGGAKMPYMHRLTNFGLAIHQGNLPGYPASHGCIRVSKSSAKRLWRWSREGIKVKIYGDANDFTPKRKFAKKRKINRGKKRIKHKRFAKRKSHLRDKKRFVKNRYLNYKRYPKRVYRQKNSIKYIPKYQLIEVVDTW